MRYLRYRSGALLVASFAACLVANSAADLQALRRSTALAPEPQGIAKAVEAVIPMRLADASVPVPGLLGISPSPTPQPVTPPQPRTHTVQAGETLSGIASDYNLHSGTIALGNPSVKDSELLAVGQVLQIPDQDAPSDQLAKEASQRTHSLASVAYAAELPTASVPASPAASTGWQAAVWPSASRTIYQGYGVFHTGIDIIGAYGSPIVAADGGYVDTSAGGWNGGYGNYVKISHGNGFETLYAHLSSYAVEAGEHVVAGQVIGYMGTTGNSTGTHLHYEVRLNGATVNPLKYTF